MGRRDDHAAQRILEHWQSEFPEDRLAHLVRDAARVLAKSLQVRLAEYSVSFGHWSFLRVLWYSEGLTQRELSEQVGLMEPTTFTALKAMEAKGLIERRHQDGNRKNLHIYLTDKGRALKDELIPIAEELNEVAVRGLSEEERRIMHRGLLAIIQNLFEAGAVS
ncbi:MarR family winged helix-turn-helix transcriptional regulator [Alloalcanivorax mobilis]|uniref:MarR family winged helix-turn-helix transcriptional regulator n=1 Tax=Alloalcanivorax mobilis TaxID=2019569 RepID=UPI000B5B2C10|nr:MarR family transcriptional regulator [Alloalcanivorax mobilis]ASK34964.1 MarR family transcriptional regulator [Alcanivorax sp. N3-2A]|tara:strand:- start:2056 stop:2547 length:492 start_codon:yes stop_codon:yes gene_type:complete